jgi:hypothetical protein
VLLTVRPPLKGSEWATGLSSLDLARQAYQPVDRRAAPKGLPIDAKENERKNHFTSLIIIVRVWVSFLNSKNKTKIYYNYKPIENIFKMLNFFDENPNR